jgi:outer membrane protein assembly factor BamB
MPLLIRASYRAVAVRALLALVTASLASLGLAGCDNVPGRKASLASGASPLKSAPIALSANASAAGSAPVRGMCGTGTWLTYGHDAQRTSASDACCRGKLSLRWRSGLPDGGGRATSISHVIADDGRVFASGVRGQSGVVARLDLRGEARWVYDSRADLYRASWLTAAYGRVLLNDDGLYLIDAESGIKAFDRGLDTWGQTLADGDKFYLVNTWHIDGPGTYVGALDTSAKLVWKRNEYGFVRGDVLDDVGAVAFDAGVLFQAASYKFGHASGVFAFDGATGKPRWSVPSQPLSHLSADRGRLFLIEKDPKTRLPILVARAQNGGSMAWSAPAPGAWVAAPVIADGKVIVLSERQGVVAYRVADGERLWAAPVPGLKPPTVLSATALAAAVGSGTLLVAAGDTLRLLSLDDGSEVSALPLGAPIHSPVLVGNRAYAVSQGQALAFDCE